MGKIVQAWKDDLLIVLSIIKQSWKLCALSLNKEFVQNYTDATSDAQTKT